MAMAASVTTTPRAQLMLRRPEPGRVRVCIVIPMRRMGCCGPHAARRMRAACGLACQYLLLACGFFPLLEEGHALGRPQELQHDRMDRHRLDVVLADQLDQVRRGG